MRLEFNSISELSEFFDFVQGSRQVVTVSSAAVTFAEGASDGEIAVLEAPKPRADAVQAEGAVESPEPKVKRTRRTKAEMEAARAADSQGVGVTDIAEHLKSDANPFAQKPDQREQADRQAVESAQAEQVQAAKPKDSPAAIEAAEFIEVRIAERPEMTQLEHLNVARAFIGKYGMDKYNQSFALAGVSNVMGFSPADCAAHAAALDFLSLE